MAVYIFSILTNYIRSGVDVAQGIRSEFLRKLNQPVYYVFEDLPREEKILLYKNVGIKKSEMLCAQLYLSGNYDLSGEYKRSEHVYEIIERLRATKMVVEGRELHLYREEQRIASLYLSENGESILSIEYFDRNRLLLRESYAGRLLYRDYFVTERTETQYYAKRVKTSFLDKEGNTAFDCLYGDNNEKIYMFPKGDTYNHKQIIEKFIKKLNLSEVDLLLIDRPAYLDFAQPLFQHKNKAKTVVLFHAGHYFGKNESISSLGLNMEYYYWFRNSDKIHTILVSTEEQKRELKECLEKFQCVIPKIEAVPFGWLTEIKYPEETRKKHSLVTVSRLVRNKHVDWIVAAVIEARKQIPDLTLDIYGEGEESYELKLQQMILENNASSYITLKGQCDVKELYQKYEIYVSASIRESLGLSVMEAIGSGNAVIGLDVRYGNRLFVEQGKNGFLLEFDAEESDDEEKVGALISEYAKRIVELCEEETDLSAFHEHSYKIAEPFLKENIEKRWMEVLRNL